MKEIVTTQYQCETCGTIYDTLDRAIECESRPVSHDKGVKVGDTVLIATGQGMGCPGIVTRVGVLSREWGHYFWERYWHTVYLDVDVVGTGGSRMLTFDDYSTMKK